MNYCSFRRWRGMFSKWATLCTIMTIFLLTERRGHIERILRCFVEILLLFEFFCKAIQCFGIRFFHNALSLYKNHNLKWSLLCVNYKSAERVCCRLNGCRTKAISIYLDFIIFYYYYSYINRSATESSLGIKEQR
jgi:hypothetical protein